MSILDGPVVFVDIETTGLSYSRGRVIEVAALRVENNQISKTFSSLVDPQTELPAFITDLTGISRSDLVAAPTFFDIADELHSLLNGALFVAHNVRFDYGFLKHEFRRAGYKFTPKQLCTVKLSKALYPAERAHKLQDLIDRCGIEVANRHRAYDDALAMWQFIQHSLNTFPAPVVDAAIKRQIKTPSLPKNISADLISTLSENSGVYIFQDETGSPLYIGKSVNLRKRVLSHFNSDHEYESEFKIAQQVAHIETIETNGELEALLLESKLIKDQQPLYNRQLRRRQKMTLARQKIQPNGYIGLSIEDAVAIEPNRIGDILGVYPTKGKARQFIDQIIKDYSLCPKLMGFEKGRGACFAYQLKRCMGACTGKETVEDYNHRLLTAFEGRRLEAWPYRSPIVIEEKTERDEVRSFVVDQWCVVADISCQPECEPVIRFQEKMFDIDTYKILRSYLASKAHKLSIRPITIEQLQSLVSA